LAGSRRRWWLWRDCLRQARPIDVEIRSGQSQLDTPSGLSSERLQQVGSEFVVRVAHQVSNTQLPNAKPLCRLPL
jgi:hypothetical protein